MKISRKEIEHVAHLARLNLSEAESKNMTESIDNILSYFAKLDEVETNGIHPTTHAFAICNAFRDDAVKESLSQKEALENCAEKNEEAFIVPRIL